MAENFFSILKTECIYRHKPAAFRKVNGMNNRYIDFYNHKRIQLKTGVAAAHAAPLRLKLLIFLHGHLLVPSAQFGAALMWM